MPNVIELLKKDHRTVEELFKKIEKTEVARERKTLFAQLATEVEVHASAEETALYPKVEKMKELEELALEAYEEHNEVREIISRIEELSPEEAEWMETVEELKENIEHHVKEEESEMFPKMGKLLTQEQLIRMGSELQQAKSQLKKAS